jgi:hypothetical protein
VPIGGVVVIACYILEITYTVFERAKMAISSDPDTGGVSTDHPFGYFIRLEGL